MKKSISSIINLFFPKRCLFCTNIAVSGGLCNDCKSKRQKPIHDVILLGNDEELSKGLNKGLSCYSGALYEGYYRKQILKFKFKGKSKKAKEFADFIYDSLSFMLSKDEFDLITFVPMTASGKKKRGYNQSELIAKEVGLLCGLDVEELLVKTKENLPQRQMKSEDRRTNVKDVFDIKIEKENSIKDKRIILIDDIMTTGSTLKECADVLYKMGADRVVAVCTAVSKL